MKSPAFSYYQAKDLADAINTKKSDDDAVILAGGQSLLPTLNMRLSNPSVLIDIGSINELKKITFEHPINEANNVSVGVNPKLVPPLTSGSSITLSTSLEIMSVLEWLFEDPSTFILTKLTLFINCLITLNFI